MFGSIDLKQNLLLMSLALTLTACGGGSSSGGGNAGNDDNGDDGDDPVASCDNPITELTGALLEFDLAPNVTTTLSEDGCTVTLESIGWPDHTSAYWDPNGANANLWVEAADADQFGDPGTGAGASTPGYIDDRINDFVFTLPVNPELADTPSDTPFSEIGIAISGGPIFNDQEANGDITPGVLRSMDRNGAHTGPETYHYHLEPIAISDDDSALVGILGDGFLIYGRREWSTGDYPTDLDASNGHFGVTQHSDGEEVYHYHVDQEEYDGSGRYLVFPGQFQGTSTIQGGGGPGGG